MKTTVSSKKIKVTSNGKMNTIAQHKKPTLQKCSKNVK